ncbi:MAG: hypothetical protein AB1806_10540 [Acidobacteriota bacterium]
MAEPPPDALLVVLTNTGTICGSGLPRLTPHPAADRYLDVLARGFSGRLLRLYRHVQELRRRTEAAPIEPAYLLLSTTQGGFPRFGFCLDDEEKPSAGYVELHRGQRLSGAFGAMDQIFPHELLHVITRQLAGTPPDGGSNQVHAIGVRTDRYQAFNEGFAEHAQVMAVVDPDAAPDTAALAQDPEPRQRAWRNLDAYRRALVARWAPAPRHRIGFVLWFSATEQVLRYHAVEDNLFAREPDIPPSLLETSDPWIAYLLEHIMPGEPDAPLKPTPRLLSTEGVVAAAMTRWVTLPDAQQRLESEAFYDAFGTSAGEVTPLDNVYLKLFRVLADARPYELAGLARAYQERYPEEADALRRTMTGLGIDVDETVSEIWLASRRFTTGTTLFDQYRGLPRSHTFDLNAASAADLATVSGLTFAQARILRSGIPYASLDDVDEHRVVPPAILAELRLMQEAFASMAARSAEAEESLSLSAVFWPSIWRAVLWMLIAGLAGGTLYRMTRRAPRWRAALNGTGAGTCGLLCAWILEAPWWFAPAVPLVLLGAPAVLWQVWRRRWTDAAQVALAWLLAVLPVVVISQPLG